MEQDWSNFLASGVGSDLFLACLSQLTGLASLTIHDVATNEMMYVIADTCHRLLALDISYSCKVSDLGLIYLCGKTNQIMTSSSSTSYLSISDSAATASNRYVSMQQPPLGCKYLRELHFNPRKNTSSKTPCQDDVAPIMSRVIAYVFRHLCHLQVVNMENLFDGIECYYHGVAGEYHPRPDRIIPLKLIHYIGHDNQLANIAGICPKLRTFKITVTSSEALLNLGMSLSSDYASLTLEHVNLVYDEKHGFLSGFDDFISKCGHRINSLEISTSKLLSNTELPQATADDHIEEDSRIVITLANLSNIAQNCKLLDTLHLNCLKMEEFPLDAPSPVPRVPLEFRFLTSIRLSNIHMPQYPKEIFKYILGNSLDVEKIQIQLDETASNFFFNDFLLDDILALNPLGRLEQFILENGALTLISALRLLSSRPKLKSIGKLLKWDVEPSELQTFEQILRKAKGLNLLRHDIQIY